MSLLEERPLDADNALAPKEAPKEASKEGKEAQGDSLVNDSFAANVVDGAGGLVVEVVGELDMTSGAYLSRVIDGLRSDDRATRLRLDLSRLTFIDSLGIGVILAAWRSWTAEGSDVEIVRGPSNVMRAFEMSGLVSTLPFVDR